MENADNQRSDRSSSQPFTRSRRDFIATGSLMGSMSWLGSMAACQETASPANRRGQPATSSSASIIGDYGPWAASLLPNPPRLSLRNGNWDELNAWRETARSKALELLASPPMEQDVASETLQRYEYDGLEIEELAWQLPYGRQTKAVVLKPAKAKGRLPAVLGLHDHGGNKYFGHRKITRTADEQHPMMVEHQRHYYGGQAWANGLARRGYVVLVHDTFTFASRRVFFEDMREIPWGDASTRGHSDEDPERRENIEAYNDWAAAHEHIMAKSLFCGGTTWPGVFLAEDQQALNVLCAREDVDPDRVGCAGLSGGGLRTVYLGGLDPRIKCAICIGFMSTWKDFLLHKSYTHTWMTYAPLLPNYLDFPEILGLRVPLPTMTQSCTEDGLYTLPEMQVADKILGEVYRLAEAEDRYQGRFYSGGHKFDLAMQQDAFEWFDRWLRQG